MKNRSGFTLIELSIVLIIIGLLVAGIVGGASLIQQAKLRTFISDSNKYVSAMHIFKLEYDALPGDIDNATDYWGLDSSGCSGDGPTAGDGTCNGDKDGQLSTSRETALFWHHLSLAEIIPNSYDGVNNHSPFVQPGVNAPISRYTDNVSVMPFSFRPAGSGGADGTRITVIAYGAIDGVSTTGIFGGLLSPQHAYSIDKKSDDGLPQSGLVWGVNGSVDGGFLNGSCNDSDLTPNTPYDGPNYPSDGGTASYILSDNSKQCMFAYNVGIGR